MRLLHLGSIILGVLSGSLIAASPQAPVGVCQVTRDAAKLIGKRIRVEGYVWNLGSHGFVLNGKRQCKGGHLSLSTDGVDGTPIWRKGFANSMGVRRAVLAGTVRWRNVGVGHRPALRVERVEQVDRHEADLKNFWSS